MRRIKSAPENLSLMSNTKKKVEISKFNLDNFIIIINKNEYNNNLIESKKQKNSYYCKFNKDITSEYILKKKIIDNKKKLTSTLSGIISDSFNETNKYIPNTDNYIFNYIVEFINNFINNKFNRKNLENFILSMMIRFIFSQIYHDIIIVLKENIYISN
jgi:hypothetical protein